MRRMLQAPEPHLTENLKKIFARLVDPLEDPVFLQTYTVSIKHEFRKDIQPGGEPKARFNQFAQACLKAGIVPTMATVVRQDWTGENVAKERYIAQYHAMDGLCDMMRTGDVSDRRKLLDKLLEEDIVGLCLQLVKHPLCLMRQLAVNTLRVIAAESFLGEKVSGSFAADIIESVCLYTLSGPDHVIEQMQDPGRTWQSQMIMGRENIPPSISSRYCPRWFAMAQESAMWTAHGLLCTSSPRSRAHCLEILQAKPQILDYLLECAALERKPWYPETQVDSIACEVLTQLFQWPVYMVPGVPTDQLAAVQEREAASQALAILTSRQDWAKKVIDIWMHLQNEDIQKIKGYFARVNLDYGAFNPPDEEAFLQVFEYRGFSRISTLRLIATLTHAADSCGIADAQIESFLHVAYRGSRKVQPLNRSLGLEATFTAIENEQETFRSPMWTVFTGKNSEHPQSVAPENILGPTALIRLFVVLAQRNVLTGIQALQNTPVGLSPSTSLAQIKQITRPDVIRQIIKMSHSRIRARLDKGRERLMLQRDDYGYACAAYTSAAELAAALIALDTHTSGTYATEIRGARKQLVVALSHASQMALNLKHYERALHFAQGGINAAENIPSEEGLDPDFTVKNRRRVKQANDGLRHRS
ncbi:hypothetical protein CONPUDRAFT_109504 [Coniophora puteana RWD-64-598 SS2]|uniref:Uncharacterized protein n=1 Tax=Coniophora puteana (strain RWD-64-598) TaxID=741705 RepID=A0A5M3MEN3_CONPW|nr:uncharacterized protein CONPUDRAFT_109504 [Coniophora puteana RWD-64-598 SS2]EIW77041.1 hypothetical protein CONPUDRAFT_109504 [Coniophora puteana RWD-64-598 SS2]